MAGRADIRTRRKSQRRGREKGCWVYIPAEQLQRAGFGPDADPPYYRAWDGRKGTVILNLYRTP
jgi:hypothetical protein